MSSSQTLQRVFELPHLQLKEYPQEKALAAKHIDGHFYSYSTSQVIELMNQLSLGFLALGIKKDDKVALISYNNRPEWNIVDFALQQIGAISVPVYPTISIQDYKYIFNDAEVKYCFVGHGDLLAKVTEVQRACPALQKIFTFDKLNTATLDANGQAVGFWEDLLVKGDYEKLEPYKNSIHTDDVMTIVYTSGTTGTPKGVMLTHKNFITNLYDVYPLIPIWAGELGFSFLPLCHVFERCVVFSYIFKGINVMYPPSIDTLADNMREFQPNFFTTVPRLLEKVYEKVVGKAKEGSKLKQNIFFWAMRLTETYDFDQKRGFFDKIKWAIADKLVFSKIRANMGGKLVGIVTGAAACPQKMIQFFSAAGIPVREGYGLSETSPGIAIGNFEPYAAKLGTVGPLLNSVQVKIEVTNTYGEGEGEVLVKGGNVMKGYYKQPELTAEVFTEDGWFRTGDIGKFVKNDKGREFLQITDRKKELLKTSNGKYIAPTPIENKLKERYLIEQVMVIGNDKKYVSALITANPEAVQNWCKEKNIPFTTLQEAITKPEVKAAFDRIVKKVNEEFGHVEQVKRYILLADAWTTESGDLTPTLKIKRRVLLEKYKTEIENLYK